MVNVDLVFLIFLVYYAIFTPLFVFLVESRLKQIEKETETLLAEYLELKKKINDSEKK